jgi:dipeptide/tripeptide permease
MTWAEILVSVTGLMFAYSQAPKRYKTVIMSAWLLTSAFGDLIVVFVAEVHLVQNQVRETKI